MKREKGNFDCESHKESQEQPELLIGTEQEPSTSQTEEDLRKIEHKMRELVGKNLSYQPSIISQQEAVDYFSSQGGGVGPKTEFFSDTGGKMMRKWVRLARVGSIESYRPFDRKNIPAREAYAP